LKLAKSVLRPKSSRPNLAGLVRLWFAGLWRLGSLHGHTSVRPHTSLRILLSEDPAGISGGLNLFGYAGDDPVNGSDPFGLTAAGPGAPPPETTGPTLSCTGHLEDGTAFCVILDEVVVYAEVQQPLDPFWGHGGDITAPIGIAPVYAGSAPTPSPVAEAAHLVERAGQVFTQITGNECAMARLAFVATLLADALVAGEVYQGVKLGLRARSLIVAGGWHNRGGAARLIIRSQDALGQASEMTPDNIGGNVFSAVAAGAGLETLGDIGRILPGFATAFAFHDAMNACK
jgi:hypothetical protein